jgi:Zn-dependent peptidase ImmA (M78 family)
MEKEGLIPSEFELLNHTINVEEDHALEYADEYGSSHYHKNEIKLTTEDVPDSVRHHTFCHELVHFLFHYAGRSDLASDEQLVDTIGGLLAQYEKTRR